MGLIRPQNLNDVFQAAANQAKQKLPELTHNQKVRTRRFASPVDGQFETPIAFAQSYVILLYPFIR